MILKFHKHKYRCKKWRIIIPESKDKPWTLLMGCECRICGKRKLFHNMPRNFEWMMAHHDLQDPSPWDLRWEGKHVKK